MFWCHNGVHFGCEMGVFRGGFETRARREKIAGSGVRLLSTHCSIQRCNPVAFVASRRRSHRPRQFWQHSSSRPCRNPDWHALILSAPSVLLHDANFYLGSPCTTTVTSLSAFSLVRSWGLLPSSGRQSAEGEGRQPLQESRRFAVADDQSLMERQTI
jgi:hypothetical protein